MSQKDLSIKCQKFKLWWRYVSHSELLIYTRHGNKTHNIDVRLNPLDFERENMCQWGLILDFSPF